MEGLKRLFLLAGVVIAIGCGFVAEVALHERESSAGKPLTDLLEKRVVMGGEQYMLLAPQADIERQEGLAVIPALPHRYGMVFSGNGRIGIWMKDMRYPIDVIWVNKTGEVIHVVYEAQPSSYPKTIYANPRLKAAAAVIEIGSGQAKRLGVTLGSHIDIR